MLSIPQIFKRISFTIIQCLWIQLGFTQLVSPEPVKKEDFEVDAPGESAVYLINDGHTNIKYHDEGGYYRASTEVLIRIKILSKTGLDLGNFKISRYVAGNAPRKQEFIRDIKAVTYNLNETTNQIEISLLNDKQIIRNQSRSKVEEISFALSNVKVNSIIQISYVKDSPFLTRFEDWYFQKDHPVEKSTYSITNASTIRYVYTLQGQEQTTSFQANMDKQLQTLGRVRQFDTDWWSATEIPAYRKEPFTSTREDYIAKLGIQMKSTGNRDYVRAWEYVGHDLQENKRFKNYYSGKTTLKSLEIPKGLNPLNKAKYIYEKFKSIYSWNGKFGVYPSVNFKELNELKKGNETALGLALFHILEQVGLEVHPVLISPRFNGKLNYYYPFLDMFIATIVRLKVDDEVYLLDPVHDIPFGYLDKEFLNGKGLVLGNSVTWQDLNSNDYDYKDSKVRVQLEGKFINTKLDFLCKDYGIDQNNKDLPSLFHSDEWTLIDVSFDQDESSVQSIKARLKMEVADDFISIPLVFDKLIFKENPFEAKERLFPIEFYFKKRYKFNYTIQISDEFRFESIPKSRNIRSSDGNMSAILSVKEMGNQIEINFLFETKINSFPTSDYEKIKAAFELMEEMTTESIFIKSNSSN